MKNNKVGSEKDNLWWKEVIGLVVENGSLHLFGRQDATGNWSYRIVTNDRLEELFNEDANCNTIVDSWSSALRILDRNYWIFLIPSEPILSEFKLLIWDAIRARTDDQHILEIWRKACNNNALKGGSYE
jgi:hypothetical protein